MKKLSILLALVFLLVSAGSAMAEPFDVQLSMYDISGDTNKEFNFDTGVDSSGPFGPTTFADAGDGLTLTDLGLSSWADVQVGLYGGAVDEVERVPSGFGFDVDQFNYEVVFTSTVDPAQINLDARSNFTAFYNAPSITEGQEDIGADNSYHSTLRNNGVFMGNLSAVETDLNLDASGEGSLYFIRAYGSYLANGPVDGTLGFETLGQIDFSLDNGNLKAVMAADGAEAVPVPAAVWLLGSGLLGLLGLRKRMA